MGELNQSHEWSQVSAMGGQTEPEEPRRYRVLMLNDDYTPMDFVVMVLGQYFGKSSEEAVSIMLAVHNQGKGVCGVFTKDVAETKMMQVTVFAREQGFPLICEAEAE